MLHKIIRIKRTRKCASVTKIRTLKFLIHFWIQCLHSLYQGFQSIMFGFTYQLRKLQPYTSDVFSPWHQVLSTVYLTIMPPKKTPMDFTICMQTQSLIVQCLIWITILIANKKIKDLWYSLHSSPTVTSLKTKEIKMN